MPPRVRLRSTIYLIAAHSKSAGYERGLRLDCMYWCGTDTAIPAALAAASAIGAVPARAGCVFVNYSSRSLRPWSSPRPCSWSLS